MRVQYFFPVMILVMARLGVADTWNLANRGGFGDPANLTAEAAVAVGTEICIGTRNRATYARVFCSDATATAHRWSERTPTSEAWRANKSITQMILFGGDLFLSTELSEIWRRNASTGAWSRVNPVWTHVPSPVGITDLAVFGGYLYAVLGAPIEVYRSRDGVRWDSAMAGRPLGFGRDAEAAHTARFGHFQGRLVLGTGQINPGSAAGWMRAVQVWSFDGARWSDLTESHLGLGDSNNGAVLSLREFRGDLFVGTHNTLGAKLWRGRMTASGAQWTNVSPPSWESAGPGVQRTVHAHSLAVLSGYTLFVGTREAPPPSSAVWGSRNGTRWLVAGAAGEGMASSTDIVSTLVVVGRRLYATTWNATLGTEVYWRTPLPLDGHP